MLRRNMTGMIPLAGAFIICAVTGCAQQVQIGGRSYNFTSFDVPGAVTQSAPRISNLGLIVGYYTNASGATLGFYKPLLGPVVNGLKDPNDIGNFTRTAGVNDEGVIAGGYAGTVFQGFTLQNGHYTTVQIPGSTLALINGINDFGAISGQANTPASPVESVAFISFNGNPTFFTYLPGGTFGQNVNNLFEMVGESEDSAGNFHSFFRSWNGTLQPIAYPNAISTLAVSVNDLGEIAGNYKDQAGNVHGFLYVPIGQKYLSFDVPGAASTHAGGLNDLGFITGEYLTPSGDEHCFILEPQF